MLLDSYNCYSVRRLPHAQRNDVIVNGRIHEGQRPGSLIQKIIAKMERISLRSIFGFAIAYSELISHYC